MVCTREALRRSSFSSFTWSRYDASACAAVLPIGKLARAHAGQLVAGGEAATTCNQSNTSLPDGGVVAGLLVPTASVLGNPRSARRHIARPIRGNRVRSSGSYRTARASGERDLLPKISETRHLSSGLPSPGPRCAIRLFSCSQIQPKSFASVHPSVTAPGRGPELAPATPLPQTAPCREQD
jgi:hypothetical protein